jgi:hypothetical protein
MNLFIALEAGHEAANSSLWGEAWSIFTDPSHIIAELGWTIIQDVILVWLLYGTLWKKVILPRLHEKFDKEHKIVHHDDEHDHGI